MRINNRVIISISIDSILIEHRLPIYMAPALNSNCYDSHKSRTKWRRESLIEVMAPISTLAFLRPWFGPITVWFSHIQMLLLRMQDGQVRVNYPNSRLLLQWLWMLHHQTLPERLTSHHLVSDIDQQHNLPVLYATLEFIHGVVFKESASPQLSAN